MPITLCSQHPPTVVQPGSSIVGPATAAAENEALIRRRFVATGVDIALASVGLMVLGPVHWAYVALLLGAFALRDWGECYSPGKRILGLNVLRGGNPCTFFASIARNLTLMPPLLFIELALLLFSDHPWRIGDSLAGTRVVLSETPEAATHAAQPPAMETLDTGSLEILTHAAPADDLDPAIIDAGLLTPDRITPEEIAPANPADYARGHDAPDADAHAAAPRAATAAISLEAAARCLAIEGEVSYETLDDAYWQYVERYSPDAAEKLTDAELIERCTELAAAKAALPLDVPSAVIPTATRDACMAYLNEWLMLINKCRDTIG